jgi:hypothetical protein
LGETRSLNDGQGDFSEGFQHAFGRRLAGATFGIASEQTGKLYLLLTETLPKHPFEQRHDAQGDGEQAHQSYPMVIALHVQRSQGQGTAFETCKVAFHQIFVAVRFDRLLQRELAGEVVGGIGVLSTYENNGRACKKEGRGKEKKQKKRSGQCSALPQFLFW